MLKPLTISLLYIAAAAAQDSKPPAVDPKITSEQAPPETDAALRARIQQFYQAHVDGKFRLANQVVADDSQDLFFAIQKPRYLSFEIARINYSPDFTRADAVVGCRSEFVAEGRKFMTSVPVTSHWKLVDGEWFWYMDPTAEVKSPFGMMHMDPNQKGPEPTTAMPDPQAAARAILSAVQADKTDVRLSGYEPSSAEVHIKNGMLGPVHLSVNIDGAFPGLIAQLDKTDVKGGDTAALKIACDPKDRSAKPTLTARVTVQPTEQVLNIRLTFAIPPEVEKLIPPSARPAPQH
jgi:hypothetical protein